jgi:hypothetical protein
LNYLTKQLCRQLQGKCPFAAAPMRQAGLYIPCWLHSLPLEADMYGMYRGLLVVCACLGSFNFNHPTGMFGLKQKKNLPEKSDKLFCWE